MAEHPDVLIVGGGIIGLSAAYYLAQQQVQVAVVERGDFGREASWAGAGIIPPPGDPPSPSALDRLRAISAGLFPQLSAELKEHTGIDNAYLRCGGLELVENDAAACKEWQRTGIHFQVLGAAELHQLEPNLAPAIRAACLISDMAQVRTPRHVRALMAGCQALGVRLRAGCPVEGFEQKGHRIVAARCLHERLVAGRFLVTAGPWTDAVLASLGMRLGVEPVRGQIALLHPPTPLLRHIVERGKQYLVPRSDGRVLAGSTEEHVGFDQRTTAEAIRDLLAFAISVVPELRNSPLERSWAGLRPGSADERPFIGPAPGFENLFVAAGHFRTGIELSPGTALLIQELFLGRPLTLSLDAFRLDRHSAPERPHIDSARR